MTRSGISGSVLRLVWFCALYGLLLPCVAVSQRVTAPRVIHRVDPQYTYEVRKARIEGTVVLRTIVETDGTVRDVWVTRPLHPDLDKKAIEAVRQWKFEPGMKDGRPVRVRAEIEVAFRLLPSISPGVPKISAAPEPPLLWEKKFSKPVQWHLATASGVLLARSGKTLFAVEARDGRELWSMEGLSLGAGDERGKNLVEIPSTAMLLALRDRPTASGGVACGTLLAVDLRNGRVIAQLREIAEVYQDVPCSLHQLIPFRTGTHALLVTQPDLGLPSLKQRVHLLSFQAGPKIEWQDKYPDTATFHVLEDALYVQKGGELSRLDLRTGKATWTVRQVGALAFGRGPAAVGGKGALAFGGGKAIVGGKQLRAVDAVSGQILWTSSEIQKVSSILAVPGAVFVGAEKAVFALDASSGAVRWRVDSDSPVSNLLLLEEGRALVGAEKSAFVIIDTASGKIARRINADRPQSRFHIVPLIGPSLPEGLPLVSFAPVGPRFFTAVTRDGLALFDWTTGKEEWTEKLPEALAAEPQSRAVLLAEIERVPEVSMPMQGLVGALQSMEFKRKLQALFTYRAAWLGHRLRRTGSDLSVAAFATKLADDKWKLWRIESSTGRREECVLSGSRPEFVPELGLCYTASDNTLRAFRIQSAAFAP